MDMKKTLTEEEKKLLRQVLARRAPELVEKVDLLEQGLVDLDTIHKIRDGAVGDELINKGFDDDSNPNEYGLELEKLIDTIADLYIWPESKKHRS
jgi:hypothetical protein